MKQIPISRGKFSQVDDTDFESLSQYTWFAIPRHGKWYAARNGRIGTSKKTVYMHRDILNAQDGLKVDHIDGDGLNNTRENLRFATDSQNQANRSSTAHSSKYKGVFLDKNGYWKAEIEVNGDGIFLGYFDSEERAALAYNEAAIKHFREYAKLNDVDFHGPSFQKARLSARNTSGYKGVSLNRKTKLWTVHICGRTIGYFNTPYQAARAYDEEAVLAFGAIARVNFPELVAIGKC